MTRVRLEIMPWLSRYFGADGSGRVILDREVRDGATVSDLLEEIASQNPELREVLFAAKNRRLPGHIILILNGRFVQLAGGLDATLRSGDTIRLMPTLGGG